MRKITLLLMLLVSFSGFAQFPLPYCGPMTFTSNVEPITLVEFAGINNTSSALVGQDNATTIFAHEDYTAMVGNVTAGSNYPITLKGNTDGNFTTSLRVYIDWNQNNDFTDLGESYDIGNIVNSTGVDATQLVGSIAVPGTVMGGNTRMRVIKRYNGFGTSCQTGTGFGQAEDYTLSVTAVLPCLTGLNYPDTTVVPGTCDGFTPTEIATDSYAGDYFYVTVTTGQTYKFSSSVTTDYFTLSTDDGATAAASGTTPLTWVSNFTGDVRVHLNTGSACGTEDEERTTSVICGVTCLTGYLYPDATYSVPVCDGTTANVVVTDSYAGEYANVNVFDANDYVFSSSVATDYITVASADGLTVFAVGTGSVNYGPTADGVVRVYFHTNSTCGTQATNRERRIVCTTALTVPECATNPNPADGAINVPAFTPIALLWVAPATGDPATSYDIYVGDSLATMAFAGNVTTVGIPNAGQVDGYNTTVYWQVVPRNAAGAAVGCAIWSFTTEPQPTDTPNYVNLQWPPTISVTQGGTGTVYGRVYEPGLTDVTSGQAAGILAWVGISPIGDNSNPDTWTDWTPATFNVETDGNNNDEYQAAIGATLAPGTYYYATRFTLNGGPYVYGGIDASNNGNFWDGTTYNSGVLTINPAPPPANDACAGAIALTAGGVFADNVSSGTVLGATNATETPTCAFNNTQNSDVWYTVTIPASGNLTIETQTEAANSLTDTTIAAFSGACGSLVQVACDDDAGLGLMSLMALTGQTPGAVIYIGVWKWGTAAPFGTENQFKISAYDASLGNSSFDNTNFLYYPNPVKNTLNLSYNQEISNVEVYNLLGQRVSSSIINANNAQVDMSNLSKGAYLVRVASNNQVKTVKVIKE
ncbi:MAG: T9SS type A sorting domain-containing protein [Bacteroidota bacterium]